MHDSQAVTSPQPFQAGYSFIGLLVALSITALLAVGGHQAIEGALTRLGFLAQRALFQQTLFLAQSGAQILNQSLVLCGSQSGSACDGQWSKGWLLQIEQGQKQHTIRFVRHKVENTVIEVRGFLGRNAITISPSAYLAQSNGRIRLHSTNNGIWQRSWIVSRSGRIRALD